MPADELGCATTDLASESSDTSKVFLSGNTRSKKRRNRNNTTRTDALSVVIGPVISIEKFHELLNIVNTLAGKHRSFYYRHEQKCGFVNFFDEDTVSLTIQKLNGYEFDGNPLKVATPLTYFGNEEDAKPYQRKLEKKPDSSSATTSPTISTTDLISTITEPNAHVDSVLTNSKIIVTTPVNTPNFGSSASPNISPTPTVITKLGEAPGDLDMFSAVEPSPTLVLKNLPFNLRQERLLAVLTQGDIEPQSVNYQYDHTGTFRGMAFAKYMKLEDAVKAYERLGGMEIEGRSVRVEYKRRNDGLLPFSAPEDGFDMLDLAPNGTFQQLLAFKENAIMKEIAFVDTLTMNQRSQIHMIAERLGLNHTTTGTTETRYVIVSKPSCDAPVTQNRQGPRSVSIQETAWYPRAPDGTKGFSIGRGRRSSTPHPILKQQGPVPLQHSSRSVSVPTFPQRGAPSPSPRELSVPRTIVTIPE